MANHQVYKSIVMAIRRGSLTEPFGVSDFRKCCPGFAEGTYKAFLYKHKLGNGATSELFEHIGKGLFRLLRPIKYGL